jgi:hypothetical protein
VSETRPPEEPWEHALQLGTVAMGRGAGVMLDMHTREAFIKMLREGWARARAEHREEDYDAAAQELVDGLVDSLREVRRGRITEYRDGRPQAGIVQLPPEVFADAVRSLCPIWPFC